MAAAAGRVVHLRSTLLMFEIGNTLREARLRRGVEIAQAEADTKIRAKYLRAMEEEQFDLLPAPSYVRGFLKSYAEYLGLDGRLVLDEYESRFGVLADVMGDDPGVRRRQGARSTPSGARPAPRGRRDRRPRERRSEAQLLWMAIGGVTGVALLVWLGIGGESAPPAPVSPAPAPAPAATPAPAPARAAAPAPPAAPKRPARVTVVFTGTGDTGSYLEVRGRNAQGATAYSGILAPGTSERFTVRRSLWVRVGNTDGVEVTVDGRARALDGGTADFIVTRSGVRRIDDAG